MFKIPEGSTIRAEAQKIEGNYRIQPNDLLILEVYTNKGERILDQSLATQQPSGTSSVAAKEPTYLVKQDGTVRFPLIDNIKLEGLTLQQAIDQLQTEFKKYYQEPFVVLRYYNKRVVVLGSPGGAVIPLTNENIRLTEIIALAKGISHEGKAHNIRILRGDTILLADLSTIDGYLKTNYIVQPNDVIYIEPVRRPALEAFKDYSPVLSVLTTLTTIVILIVSLNQ